MTDEELKLEAIKYLENFKDCANCKERWGDCADQLDEYCLINGCCFATPKEQDIYLAGVEPREKRITELEQEKSDLVQEKYNLEYKIENLENKIEHHQEVINTLQKKNAELEKEKQDLEWQLQEVAKDNENYQKENAELRAGVEKRDLKCM